MPNQVVQARERLAHALACLEDAVNHTIAGAEARTGDLEAARAEAAALRETQELLAQRLESAIGRLRGLLDQ